MGKKSRKSAQKSLKNVQSSLVDSAYSLTIFVFSREGNLEGAFLEVGNIQVGVS